MRIPTNRINWNRDELIVAFNLYCKTPFTKINTSNKGINELALIIHRSPSSVALKLANFARLDPALQQRHISGMRHGSKAEEDIWNEFSNNWEELAYQSEVILAGFKCFPVENSAEIDTKDLPKEGKEREAVVKTRVNQNFFRRTVLASYDNKCCITGISIPGLLIASHIIPWVVDKKNRMNPCNGLCLSPLYDAAFDKGLITVNPDYKIELSPELKNSLSPNDMYFLPFEGKEITLPQRFIPSKEFLEHHSHNIFKKL